MVKEENVTVKEENIENILQDENDETGNLVHSISSLSGSVHNYALRAEMYISRPY